MGIYVKIRKHSESNNLGYYTIYSQNYEDPEFYMKIDKSNKMISFYLTQDFKNPIKIIDYKVDQPIGSLPNISMIVYSRVLIQAIKNLEVECFPDILDYCA